MSVNSAANSDPLLRPDLGPDLNPHRLAGMIRKLRWARLEHEAEQLELIMCSVPPGQRATVSSGPFSTD